MSTKTKILVFHMKELIYTAVFVVLGIILLLLMIFMLTSDRDTKTAEEIPTKYTAGIYTASMTLGGNPVEIAVTVDEDYISSIRFRQLSETVSAMYPLMEPALESLGAQPEDTWVFEDALYAIKSAKAAGFYTVGIYDETSRNDQEAIAGLADRYAREINFVEKDRKLPR